MTSCLNKHLLPIVALLLGLALPAAVAHAQVPPVNDMFVDALVLATDDSWSGSNANATTEAGEPLHFGRPTGATIWFQWTAPQDGYVTVDTFGSNFDTVLAMYTGVAVDQLTAIAGDDDTSGLQSQMRDVPVLAGTVYPVVVAGYQGDTGSIVLNVSFFDGTDVTPPQITILTPSEGEQFVQNAIVAVSYSCDEGPLGSGVASCVGDVATGEGLDTTTQGAQTFTVTATDVAGNVGSSTVNYMVTGTDMLPPVVAIYSPAPDGVYAVDAVVNVNYECWDENQGTGLASCVGDLPVGAALDTSVAGAYQFSVTGTDNAGNALTGVTDYQVVNPPDNDDFANAVLLSGDTGSWNGTNVGATIEPGEPDHVALGTEATIWFRYTPALDGFVTIDTFGSNFDTAIAMYTGATLGTLVYVAANNNSNGVQSRLSNIAVTAGVTYQVAVDGYFNARGLVTLNWAFVEQYDFTPPVITFWSPADGETVPQDDPLWAGYSCYDPVPTTGLVSCEGNINSGRLIDTSIPGVYDFTVTAVDGQGLVTTETHTYTVLGNPPNDDFVDASLLSGASGSVSGSNVGATDELSEPFHAGTLGGASVWFNWTAPEDGFLSADTLGSDFDTLLAIYTGTAVNALTEVDSNDNSVGALSAIHDAPVSAGVTYAIVVSGAWGEIGNYTLNWSFLALNDVTPPLVTISSPAEGGMYMVGTAVQSLYECIDEQLGSGIASCVGDVPSLDLIDTQTAGLQTFTVTGTDNSGNSAVASVNYTVLPFTNDNFLNALPISGSGRVVASNAGATLEPGEPAHAGDPGGASVWFRWSAVEDGYLSVETLFSNFDTTLAVYTGATVDALTEIASDNDSLGQQSRLQDIAVTAGQVYHIAVDGVGGATGQIDLRWLAFNGPTFTEISPLVDPLWVTDAEHDFWLNAAAPADVDGDGDLDLAAIGYYVEYSVSATDMLVVFMNEGPDVNGNWVFSTQEVPLNGLSSNESDLAWGDFDGDGDPDLAVAGENATELYRNDAGVLVPIATDLPGYNEDSNYSNAYDLRSLTWADYDNDADLDLLIPSTFDDVNFAYGTALMRNDGPDGAGGWTFTEVPAQVDAAVHAQTAWADNDGDGDLDLFMANMDNLGDNGFIRTYRNDGGVFTSAEPLGNLDIDYGMADWSDYDGDGDLDILIVGLVRDLDGLYKTLLRIYNNVNGVYQPNTIVQSSFFPWLDLNAATWADYDSDGDVDILLTGSVIGEDNIEGKSEVYVNDGGVFVPLGRDLPAPIDSSGSGGAFTWFDVDGDGDLDYFVAGAYWVPGGNNLIETQMHLYRNDSIVPNAAPDPPGGLDSNPAVARAGGGNAITLSWNTATDDSTPGAALTYDLEVRPQGAGGAPSQGRRVPQPGDVSSVTSWTLFGLAPGTYNWSVRAVDAAFNGSLPAQASFTIGGLNDADGDGVSDDLDNCTAFANPAQSDTDGDGFGNRCDADLNSDCTVNAVDLGLFRAQFFAVGDNAADFSGDGQVNAVDLGILRQLFFQAPGPSGVATCPP